MTLVETGADLNAYAQVEGQSGCYSPGMTAVPLVACGENLHGKLADLRRRHDVNDYAASMRILAIKP